MLVDCDLRNPTLTARLLTPTAEVGLMDVLYGKAKSDGTLSRPIPESRAEVLPRGRLQGLRANVQGFQRTC